jgi:hypothetical protein
VQEQLIVMGNPLHLLTFRCTEKVYQKVREVLGDRPPTANNLPKLRYLKAILEETFRLRPILPTLGLRQTTEEGMIIANLLLIAYSYYSWKNFSSGN